MRESLDDVNAEAWRGLSEAQWGSRASRQRWFHDDLLHPAILELVGGTSGPILDFGCGDGALAAKLHRRTGRLVHAYDPMPGMVEEARRALGPACVFGTLDELSLAPYQTVVANMVLQTVEDVDGVLGELVACSAVGASLLVSVPHPCFTLIRELHRSTQRSWVSAPVGREPPLRGSLEPLTFYFDHTVESVSWTGGSGASTFLFNRTIEEYVDAFAAAGLQIQAVREPRPTISLGEDSHPDLVHLFSRVPAFVVFALQRGEL